MKTKLAGAFAALLLVAACGGDDTAQVKANISEALLADGEALGDAEVTKEQSDCIADGMVDGIGVDKLKEYKVVKDDNTVDKSVGDVELEEPDARVVAESFVECVDVAELIASSTGGALDSLPPEAKSCFEEAFTDEVLVDFLTEIFANGEPDTSVFEGAVTDCLAG